MGTPEPLETYASKFSSSDHPKDGLVIPNRVFVGGISSYIREDDLRDLFSYYGTVKAVKIIFDKNGTSKRYGFVTFEQEVQAKRAIAEGCVYFKERILNVAPAVKRQGSMRKGSEDTSPYSSGLMSPASSDSSSTTMSCPSSPPPNHYYLTSQGTYPMVYAHPVLIPAGQACYLSNYFSGSGGGAAAYASGAAGAYVYHHPSAGPQVLGHPGSQFYAYGPPHIAVQAAASAAVTARHADPRPGEADKMEGGGGGGSHETAGGGAADPPCKMYGDQFPHACYLTPPPTPVPPRLASFN